MSKVNRIVSSLASNKKTIVSLQSTSLSSNLRLSSKIAGPALAAIIYIIATVTSSLLVTMVIALDVNTTDEQGLAKGEVVGGSANKTGNRAEELRAVVPGLKYAKKPLYLALGMKGRINCPLDGDPPNALIVWTYNERTIDLDRSTRHWVTRQGMLILRTVVESDGGRYACISYSPMDEGQTSPTVIVIVKDPPHFVVRPAAFYQREPSQSVTMSCSAEGDPTPTVVWQKVDGVFPSVTRTLQDPGSLTIARLTRADQGTYECSASNIVARAITQTLLLIETAHGPYNVTVKTFSHHAVITWHPSYNFRHAQHYVLWFRASEEVSTEIEWQTLDASANATDSSTTCATIYNLQPGVTYQFMVMSRDDVTEGLFSPVVTESTLDIDYTSNVIWSRSFTRPSGNGSTTMAPISGKKIKLATVADLTVMQQSDGLLIRWTLPFSSRPLPSINPSSFSAHPSVPPTPRSDSRQLTANVVQHFKLEYRTVGPWLPLARRLSNNTTSYLWTSASRGATYYFRVVSLGRAGEGNTASEPVSFYTGDPMGVEGTGALTGGVSNTVLVGGIMACLLIAASAAAITTAVWKRRRRRQLEKVSALRYGNVKYLRPSLTGGNSEHAQCNSHDIVENADQQGRLRRSWNRLIVFFRAPHRTHENNFVSSRSMAPRHLVESNGMSPPSPLTSSLTRAAQELNQREGNNGRSRDFDSPRERYSSSRESVSSHRHNNDISNNIELIEAEATV